MSVYLGCHGKKPTTTNHGSETMTITKHPTQQTAYAGRFALRERTTGKLLHGGGVIAPRPRLYDTEEAAAEAAAAIDWADAEVVLLTAKD